MHISKIIIPIVAFLFLNGMQPRTRQERVCERGQPCRVICYFSFCNLHDFFFRFIENVESYNRMHARTRQEGVCERVKSCRVIYYSMFLILAESAPDAGSGVTRTAVSDSTTLCVKDQTGLGDPNSLKLLSVLLSFSL